MTVTHQKLKVIRVPHPFHSVIVKWMGKQPTPSWLPFIAPEGAGAFQAPEARPTATGLQARAVLPPKKFAPFCR